MSLGTYKMLPVFVFCVLKDCVQLLCCVFDFSDGMVYVFTSNVKRMASEADQQTFERSVRELKTDGLPEEQSVDGKY